LDSLLSGSHRIRLCDFGFWTFSLARAHDDGNPDFCSEWPLVDTVQSLQAEMVRILKSMRDARDAGDDLLAQQAARCLARIADLQAATVAQEQQQSRH
jgi:hypothetical protein